MSIADRSCDFAVHAGDKELFIEWYKASATYGESLSSYDMNTWAAYSLNRIVVHNEYLKGKGIPPDGNTSNKTKYYDFYNSFAPQIRRYYRSIKTNIPDPIPEELKERFVIQAIEDMRRIIADSPRTTTPLIVFRALRQKYDPSYITGFMSTGTDLDKLREFGYIHRGGDILCIRVPVGTPCVVGLEGLCEITFSDNVKLKPIASLGIPEIDALGGLYFDLELPVAGGNRKKRSTGVSRKKKRKSNR